MVSCVGSSLAVGVAKDSRVGLAETEMSKMDPFASSRPAVVPSGGASDYYQGSVVQRSGQSFDQGSPSSLDSKSANSHTQDRRDTANWDRQVNQKDSKKATTKRKRGDSSSPMELQADIPAQLDPHNTVVSARNGKMLKAEASDALPGKNGEHSTLVCFKAVIRWGIFQLYLATQDKCSELTKNVIIYWKNKQI